VYLQQKQWLEPGMPAPFTTGRRPVPVPVPAPRTAKRSTRKGCAGLGANWTFSVSPGDPCYDPSHDNGQTHYRHWFPGLSAAEGACLAGNNAIILTNPAALTPGLPVGYDPTTGAIDPSNTTGDTVLPTQADIQSAFSGLLPNPSSAADTSFWATWGMPLAILGGAVALYVFAGRGR
jgi:hypothetical protein